MIEEEAEEEEDDEEEDEEGEDDEDEEEGEEEGGSSRRGAAAGSSRGGAGAGSVPAEDAPRRGAAVFRPGRDTLAEGEQLDVDPSAYVMYHTLASEWPCLSFDTVPDRLGAGRTKFPLSLTMVAGTQADSAGSNTLLVMRLSSLNRMEREEEAEEEEEDSDEEEGGDDDPILEVQRIPHPSGAVNRVRVMPQAPHVVATWSEAGRVALWDIRSQLAMLDAAAGRGGAAMPPRMAAIASFEGSG